MQTAADKTGGREAGGREAVAAQGEPPEKTDGREAASAQGEPPDEALAGPNHLTVEQLAAEVGMSVRNIRNHHSRGLLPPPEVRSRVGYYNSDHIARLRLILDLQADGFNLAAIERLLSGSDGVAERLLGLRRAVTTPFEAESPELITSAELIERFGEVDAKDAERIRKLKLLIPLGDGRFEVPSPGLFAAAEQIVRMGIPLHAGLSLVERVSHDCESISRAFTKLFLREVWGPFEEAGQPDERWDEVIANVNSLRPMASEALLSLFKLRMTTELESAFGKVLEHQVKRR